MKKKALFTALVVALVLTTLAPVAALAAKPTDFNALGSIASISPGTVIPAGESGRWRVVERELSGILSGDINGDFTMTYKANVELLTQAGNLHGTLVAGSYVAKVNGKIQPLQWLGVPYASPAQLTITGRWTFVDEARGQGDFTATAIVVLNEYGHVVYIPWSQFIMTGKWQP